MLKLINNLKPFFEDCYRRINVREYAKIIGVSPPTASSILNDYHEKNLLIREAYRNNILFYANKDSADFVDLSRLYWRHKLGDVVKFVENNIISPTIILFGSLSKAETKQDSDIDLAVFAHKKELKFDVFEKKLKRKIQVFWFASIKDIKSKDLASSIINGYPIKGRIVL